MIEDTFKSGPQCQQCGKRVWSLEEFKTHPCVKSRLPKENPIDRIFSNVENIKKIKDIRVWDGPGLDINKYLLIQLLNNDVEIKLIFIDRKVFRYSVEFKNLEGYEQFSNIKNFMNFLTTNS